MTSAFGSTLVYVGEDSLPKAFSLKSVVPDGHKGIQSRSITWSQTVLKGWEERVISILIQGWVVKPN